MDWLGRIGLHRGQLHWIFPKLAQLVGASRETVNKALADFAGRNWLRLDGRAVLITDVERLEKRGK